MLQNQKFSFFLKQYVRYYQNSSYVLGIDDAVIREGLNHVALTSLRTELVEKGNALVLLDAYKSNPI
ncbi:hypothetical protein PT115_09100, partial [Erysipelothrix rhusiopathiae]|nr:hypothetical protein [Erysipelothrix rhusiopathiae]